MAASLPIHLSMLAVANTCLILAEGDPCLFLPGCYFLQRDECLPLQRHSQMPDVRKGIYLSKQGATYIFFSFHIYRVRIIYLFITTHRCLILAGEGMTVSFPKELSVRSGSQARAASIMRLQQRGRRRRGDLGRSYIHPRGTLAHRTLLLLLLLPQSYASLRVAKSVLQA